VPAFGQPVPLSVPGTTNASATPYDPDNPPAGSIIVTLDFLDPLDK
jgi:hypothetical protein